MGNQLKSSEKKSSTSYYQKWKKKNRMFIPDFRGIQEIRKPTENKDNWGNTDRV